jgi:hypothetical protein
MFYQCPNGHYVHHLDDYDTFFSTGRNQYESIAQWISLDISHIEIAWGHQFLPCTSVHGVARYLTNVLSGARYLIGVQCMAPAFL